MKKSLFVAAIAGTALAAPVLGAGFVGDYAPANWSLDLFNSNGFVQQHDANTLVLVGSDNGSGGFGYIDIFIGVAQTGFISFDWAYDSVDDPGFDSSLYFSDGSGFVLLSSNPGDSGSILNLPVTAGDFFAFSVETADNLFGPGVLTVTNFSFIPAPGAAGLLALGGLAAVRRRR
ncbi:MAG: PEP-CTERM sorting domain-containing protein [Phycisphaeraceae bacterium]|nr:MAG: PEP-CTERM sorting domain-containing protein [Phycisphaeraceae bacterium]